MFLLFTFTLAQVWPRGLFWSESQVAEKKGVVFEVQ